MQIEFKKVRTFGEKINSTFAYFSQNSRAILRAQLLVAGPLILAMLMCATLFFTYFISQVSNTASYGSGAANSGNFAVIGFAAIGIGLFYILGVSLIIALAFRQIRQYIATGSAYISVSALYRTIWGEMFQVIGTGIVATIIASAVGLAVLIPLFSIVSFVSHPALVLVLLALIFLSMALVYGAVSMLFPLVHLERINLGRALGRVFSLLRGNWWSTAGLVLVMIILISTISSAFIAPAYLAAIIKALHSTKLDFLNDSREFNLYNIIQLIFTALYFAGSLVLTSLFFIAIAFHYYSLREMHEAHGLMERIGHFEQLGSVEEAEDEHEVY